MRTSSIAASRSWPSKSPATKCGHQTARSSRASPPKLLPEHELRLFAKVSVRSRGRLHSDLMYSGQVELVPATRLSDYRYRYAGPTDGAEFFNVDADGYEDRF